jgi:uncharacterized damage-inducible protein DinB
MTYYGGKELAESFRTVRRNTIQVAEDIPDDKYGFQAAEGVRTVEKLLTHIALGYKFHHQIHAVERRSKLEGFNFPPLMQEMAEEEAISRSKAEVLELLNTNGEMWASFLEGLSEEFLSETVQMMPGTSPETKSRLEMVGTVKEHEMHHRGQLMLIERMLGVVPHLTRAMQERMAAMQQQAAKQ